MMSHLEDVHAEATRISPQEARLDHLARVSHQEGAASRRLNLEHHAAIVLRRWAGLSSRRPQDLKARLTPGDRSAALHTNHPTSLSEDSPNERVHRATLRTPGEPKLAHRDPPGDLSGTSHVIKIAVGDDHQIEMIHSHL